MERRASVGGGFERRKNDDVFRRVGGTQRIRQASEVFKTLRIPRVRVGRVNQYRPTVCGRRKPIGEFVLRVERRERRRKKRESEGKKQAIEHKRLTLQLSKSKGKREYERVAMRNETRSALL
ncbi:MAG: hypothetical protein IJO06_15470 [Thermoguttaceae bacterium]|nr:hypothetical protein [Thermoguttaceae bacterium]MBQ7112595.1 hypothetical protein [Thermoguttaceae bacterium]